MNDKSGIEKAMAAIQNSRQESHLMGNRPFTVEVPECKTTLFLTRNGETTRYFHIEQVRGFYESHVGCSTKEAAAALNISRDTVVRCLHSIRAEWKAQRKLPSSR